MPDEQPKVIIIVVSWNSRTDTLECLASLETLTHTNYQVILVDNASSDGVVPAVRALYPATHIIEHSRNLGFVGGNNAGIRYALAHGARYILLLNDDATVTPSAVECLVRAAECNPAVGMACPTLVSAVHPSREYVGSAIHWPEAAVWDIERSPDGLPAILETDYAPGCALLVRSDVVRRIGLLDPLYFAYLEDVDWSLRCKRAGYRVVAVPGARVLHKGSIDQHATKSAFATYLFRRNQVLFMRHHGHWYHWPSFMKHYTRHCLLQFQKSLASGDVKRARAVVDGYWAGMSGHFGTERIIAPLWFRRVVRRHLAAWMWLTGWLYFWDYQKVKHARVRARS
ncbi:MAG TPA: glycosyltransferase family 2 protein [Chloroflexia bacterium]|nr:glycosyltransferase family 2 protein [Chloroflexia bacterium]